MGERLSLHELLDGLREGRIDDADIPAVLRCFADGFLTEADEDIEDLVLHTSPEVRAAALEVLAIRWRIADYRPLCEYVLRYDINPHVRATAARGLGAILARTRDKGALRQLLETLRDPEEDRVVRYAAYLAALEVAGAAPKDGVKERFNLRRDVDWKLVNDLLAETGEVLRCLRCGAPLIRPGDGPAWCLDCTVEVMEINRATADSGHSPVLGRD
ncbi:MAG: HEAT repeat domain-containing protein [Anaerolineae bacterium]